MDLCSSRSDFPYFKSKFNVFTLFFLCIYKVMWKSWHIFLIIKLLVLLGPSWMVHGKKWTGGEAWLPWCSSGQPVPSVRPSWFCISVVLCQPLDWAYSAAACTQGTLLFFTDWLSFRHSFDLDLQKFLFAHLFSHVISFLDGRHKKPPTAQKVCKGYRRTGVPNCSLRWYTERDVRSFQTV